MKGIRTLSTTLVLMLLLVPAELFAQSGRIEGAVVDAATGETLPGANVLIRGTSIGAAAAFDGSFTIPDVSPGTHSLIASYVGYEREERQIEVDPGETLNVRFELDWAGVQGEEITITAQARGQTQAINEQLAARTITNVVSAERIRELPDESAAAAISRLPGVSLMEGDKVVVRGIQAKMNTVTVNGIQLPATDQQDRSTQLGFISSNMLSGIEVIKAVTPAMDANSIGGTINLRLREAPEGWHYDTMLQGDYNTQDHTYKNYRLWASVSNRFADERLGAFVQGNARRFDGGGDVGVMSFSPTGLDPGYGERAYRVNQFSFTDEFNVVQEYGGSLLLDYRLPNGKIVLQNTYAATSNNNRTYIDRLNLVSQSRQRQLRLERNRNSRYLLVNALQGEHGIGDLSVDWALSHARSQHETDLQYGIDFGSVPNAWDPAHSEYITENQTSLSYEYVFDMEMNSDWPLPTAVDGATQDNAFSERRLTGALNLTMPVSITDHINGSLQAGGKIEGLARENDITRYYARLSEPSKNELAADLIEEWGGDPNNALSFGDYLDTEYVDGRGQYFLSGQRTMDMALDTQFMDDYMRTAPPGWNNGRPHVPDSYRSDYLADERLSAGYLMADFNLGRRLNILGGVRYENFSMDYEAPIVFQSHFDGAGAVLDTLSEDRSVDHWFPNVQMRFDVTDWFDVRLAYTKTLSRPDYQQLLPSTFIVGDGNRGEAGNPFLEPTVSTNYDVYLSFYQNRIGLFTIGGFIKEMDDVILQQNILRSFVDNYEGVYWAPERFPDRGYNDIGARYPISTYINNPNPARVQGIELDWQTNFWYLPRPFNSLVFNVNYTRAHSEMDYRQVRFVNEGSVLRPDWVESDTIRTARLLHQGDNVINMALGVDVRGFSGRVSFRYQGDVVTGVSASRPEEDTFTEDVYGVDFSIRQALPLSGMTLFFNGLNVTHSPSRDFRYFPVSAGEPAVEHVNRIAYYPRRFQLGLRYTF